MNDYKFGNFLCELRTEKGLSQSELGVMFGVSNKAVSKWEMGISKPRPAMLLMLASFFGVTVEELLEGGRIEKTEVEEVKGKDDTSLKLWTGEHRKKKAHGRNALLTAIFIPVLLIILGIIISNFMPDDEVIGPIFIMALIFAEVIDIALVFVFYGSARRLKRILYATYPEKAEEITDAISPKRKNVPMLKWEQVCSIISGSFIAGANFFRFWSIVFADYIALSKIFDILFLFLLVSALILFIIVIIHYSVRTRRKK